MSIILHTTQLLLFYMAHTAYLLLGSNLGKREEILENAVNSIKKTIGNVSKNSSIYETLAWGIEDQPAFLNQVIKIETTINPHQLLTAINKIEKELGRIRHEKWGERLIDIDILYYDDSVLDTQPLTIPHPEIANRKFTLVPLAEIAPEFFHPVLAKTQTELLKECKDGLEVKKYL